MTYTYTDGQTTDVDIQEYEQFMFDRPNVTEDEVYARFDVPADDLARMYSDFLSENPWWYLGTKSIPGSPTL